MKNIIFLLATLSSYSAFAQKPIHCGFTEPFYDINVDVNAKKVVISEIDHSRSDFKKVGRDISKTVNITSSLIKGVPTISVTDKKTGKNILLASLNYKGSDGMSDQEYLYDAKHFVSEDLVRSGGCDTKEIKAVDVSSLDSYQAMFFKDASASIVQCYTRAYSDWTSEASNAEKNKSVFTILYRSDYVPGEPGDVSQTFSSAEGEELSRLANLASPAPLSTSKLRNHKELKINFCDTYARFLQSRYVTEAP